MSHVIHFRKKMFQARWKHRRATGEFAPTARHAIEVVDNRVFVFGEMGLFVLTVGIYLHNELST